MIQVGTVIDDRYEVLALLGQGGLAEVYRVRHVALGSLHALKVLTWDRKALDRRLLLEGRIQAQLRHPNIVAVTDVLRVDGRASLLMEYVDGAPLDSWLEERGPLGVEPALDLFAPILAGVVCAHDAGVLHRDLKPANVLLARQGNELVPKVADFGLAKVMVDEMVAGATRAGATMGTPGYMAPEQLRDAAAADARSDVFALGAILHEMITGRPAFADEAGYIAVTATLERTPAPLEGVPDHVREAVATALAARPEDRQADARKLAEVLLLEGDPRRSRTLAAATQPVSLSEPGERPGSDTWRSSVSVPAPASRPTYSDADEPDEPDEPAVASPGRAVVPVIVAGALLFSLFSVAVLLVGGGLAWLGTGGFSEARPPPEPMPTAVAAPGSAPAPAPSAPTPDPVPTEEPAVEATAAPVPAPAPAPSSAAPAPGTAEAPQPEPVPEPEGAVQPAPEPAGEASPDPEAAAAAEEAAAAAEEAARAAMAETMARELVGTWKGQAQGRPFQLRVLSAAPELVRAEVVFNPGPAQQIVPVNGLYESGTLRMSDGSLDVVATLSGDRLTGTYARGKRPVSFEATR